MSTFVTKCCFIGSAGIAAQQTFAKVNRLRADPQGRYKALFYGDPGTGKTRLAVAIAHALAGHALAIEKLNGQSMTAERVRDWIRQSAYKSMYSDWTVRIVNEIDSSSPGAQSELIEFLDDIPACTALIATTNAALECKGMTPAQRKAALPERIHSRFIPYKFKSVTVDELTPFLTRWLSKEKARIIATANAGNVRGALADTERELDRLSVDAA